MSPRRIFTFDKKPSIGTATWATLPEDLHDIWLVSHEPESETSSGHLALEQASIRAMMGARVKLWHDDVRVPPDESWVHVRTNADAKMILGRIKVDEISMDHDLGGAHLDLTDDEIDWDFVKMDGDETGVDLAVWMAKNDCCPAKITIHSMNSVGADNIQNAFLNNNHHITNSPVVYKVPFSR